MNVSALLARWRPLGLEIAFDPDAPSRGVTPAGRAQLAADLSHLDAARLVRVYPRDAGGKLPLDELVLLAPLEVAPAIRPPKQLWLAAASPAKRSSPQVVTLTLQPEFGRNATHRWDGARWLWDARAADAPEAVRWGSAKLPIAELGGPPIKLAKSAPRDARIANAIRLVRAGRWREALDTCGVTHALSELPYKQANHGRGIARAIWDAGLDAAMVEIAPWRLEAALIAYPAPAHGLRLFNLPGQTVQRKFCVVLRSVNEMPHLMVGITASNERLPAIAWQWPPDLVVALRGDPIVTPVVTATTASRADVREADLIAQIAASPDDDDARRVYGDFLSQYDDTRGELIHLQLGRESSKSRARIQALIRKHARTWLGALGALVDLRTLAFERGFLSRCMLGDAATPFDAWAGAVTPRARHELAHVTELGLAAELPLDLAHELLADPPRTLTRLILGSPSLLPAIQHAVPELEVRVATTAEAMAAWPALRAAPTTTLRIGCPRAYLGNLANALRPHAAELPGKGLLAVSGENERVVGARARG